MFSYIAVNHEGRAAELFLPLADGSHLTIKEDEGELLVIWYSTSQEPQCMFSAPVNREET